MRRVPHVALCCCALALLSACSSGEGPSRASAGGGGAGSSSGASSGGGDGGASSSSAAISTTSSGVGSSSTTSSSTGSGAGGPAAGQLDPTFGGVRTLDETDSDRLFTMVQRPTGELLFGGGNVVDPYVNSVAWLVQRTTSGAADASFHGTGSWIWDQPLNTAVYALTVAPDGEIVGVGELDDGILAFRLTTDGALDPTFGQGGVANLLPGSFLAGKSVAVQPSGRIVIATNAIDVDHPNLIALTGDGALDPTFGAMGQLTVRATPAFAGQLDGDAFWPACVAVRADGRILVGGAAFTSDGQSGLRLGAMAIDDAGAPDPAYGQDGMDLSVVVYWGAEFWREYDTTCSLASTGRLAVSGWSQADTSQLLPIVVAFGADGRLETSFGNGGYTIVPPANDWEGIEPAGVAFQDDGRILVAGNYETSTIGVARLLASGDIDTSYAKPADASWYLYPSSDPGPDTTYTVTHLGVLADGRAVVTIFKRYSHNLLELDDAQILALTP